MQTLIRLLCLSSTFLLVNTAYAVLPEDASWDVSNPPGEWREITIDTNTTTWSFVDVSPDGKTLAFDMLGDIYTLPIDGGQATALTSGI